MKLGLALAYLTLTVLAAVQAARHGGQLEPLAVSATTKATPGVTSKANLPPRLPGKPSFPNKATNSRKSGKVPAASSSKLKNVLFIMLEDLRVELPVYGRVATIAPNIDRLALLGLTFDLASCQVSVCAPSRSSMLTGLRPDTLGIYDFSHYGGIKGFRTLPSHLHRHGYQTSSSGKLFHWDSSRLYSTSYFGPPDWEAIQAKEAVFLNSSVTPDALHGRDGFFRDSHIIQHAIRFLRDMENRRRRSAPAGEPWFLGVGLKGTHMPYHMPKRYWDMYANSSFTEYDTDLTALHFPQGSAWIHHVKKTESTKIVFMRSNGSLPGTQVEAYQLQSADKGNVKGKDGLQISLRGHRELLRGYLACLTYTDDLIGDLLATLDALSLWNDTVVVFTSDHGMHVGEKGVWGKWTLFDEASRVPLIVHSPDHPTSFGQHYSKPVELIDVFPTVLDLIGLRVVPLSMTSHDDCPILTDVEAKGSKPLPRLLPNEGPIRNSEKKVFRHVYCDPLDGHSLAGAFRDPIRFTKSNGLDFALTQRMTCRMPGDRSMDPTKPGWTDFCPFKKMPRDPLFGAMGYSMRLEDWRYIAWLRFDTNTFLPTLNATPVFEELYPHTSAYTAVNNSNVMPRPTELVNVAYRNDTTTTQLLATLRKKLYDFLWYNVSFEHLFQKRAHANPKMHPITQGRFHSHKHPHWDINLHHAFA